MTNKSHVLLSVLAILIITVSGIGQRSIDKDFLKITPGVSTREDVKALFGEPKRDGIMVDYAFSNMLVTIEYSRGECRFGFGWDKLPKWTVQTVSYNWPDGKTISLSDVIKDQKLFIKRHEGDVITDIYYINEKDGITIVFDQKNNTISSIDLEPTKRMKEKFSCSTSD